MKRISLRSLLCAAGFVLLALLPRAIRSLSRQSHSHPSQENVSDDQQNPTTTAHPLAPIMENKVRMAPRLTFVPSTRSTLGIAEGMVGEIILTGPSSMIENLEIRHFTISAITAAYFTHKFTQAQDGTWQQQELTSRQPATVQISKGNQRIDIRFRLQPPFSQSQSFFKEAMHGVNVTLIYLLDGQETRLIERGVTVERPGKDSIRSSNTRN